MEPVHYKSRHIESRCYEKGDVTVRGGNLTVKELLTKNVFTMVGYSLVDILQTSIHNAQSCMWSVVYNIFEQVMLELLREDVIGKNFGAQDETIFYKDAVA